MQFESTPATVSNPAVQADIEAAERVHNEIVDWLLDNATLSAPLHEVEAEHSRRGLELLRRLFQAHIRARGTGRVGRALLVIENGVEKRFEEGREHQRTQKTLFGPVEVVRQSYSNPGEASIHPLEQMAQMPGRSFSYEIQRRLVKESVRGPLDEARDSIEELSGHRAGKGSLEAIIMEAAVDFDAFYEQREPVPATQCGPILVAEADCKGVPMIKPAGTVLPAHRTKGQKSNKKKMAVLAAVYTTESRVRTAEEVTESLFRDRQALEIVAGRQDGQKRIKPENKRLWASLTKGKDKMFDEIAHECESRDPDHQKQRVALTDGEVALKIRVHRYLDGFTLVLDLMHVLLRLWKIAHAFHKEGSPEAIRWVKERTQRILEGKVVDVARGARIAATKQGLKGCRRKAVLEATSFLLKNRNQMQYHEYLSKGWPIATGNIEGAAKHLVKDRMERAGMRWSEAGAEALLQLRALHINGHLEDYWAFHITEDQERLHPSDRWRVFQEAG